jgi:hypothetical protein
MGCNVVCTLLTEPGVGSDGCDLGDVQGLRDPTHVLRCRRAHGADESRDADAGIRTRCKEAVFGTFNVSVSFIALLQ